MNFLAHFHLSGHNEEIAIGNFMGDFVRGSNLNNHSEYIHKGIELHRFIDDFTDHHPDVKKVNSLLHPYFSKYSPVVSDVYFDFFLASRFNQYSTETLRDYTHNIYDVIERNKSSLSERALHFYEFMIVRDIFFEYGNKDGMKHVFNGLSKRAKFSSNMDKGVLVLVKHEDELFHLFKSFYPDLQEASSNFLEQLLK